VIRGIGCYEVLGRRKPGRSKNGSFLRKEGGVDWTLRGPFSGPSTIKMTRKRDWPDRESKEKGRGGLRDRRGGQTDIESVLEDT